MASYILVRSKVNDYASWKAAYDAHIGVRKEYGLSEKHVLQSADNPNEVIVFLEAADLDRAKAFMKSPDVLETIKKSGVADKPDVYFLKG